MLDAGLLDFGIVLRRRERHESEIQESGVCSDMLRRGFIDRDCRDEGAVWAPSIRGATQPVATPVITDQEVKLAFPETPKEEESSNPAAVDQLLNKYVTALGGPQAIQKISTRLGKGTIALGANKFPFEVFEKAPNKRMSVMHLPNGDSITAFDGTSGWLAVPGQSLRDMSGAELEAARLDADFYLPLRVKQ